MCTARNSTLLSSTHWESTEDLNTLINPGEDVGGEGGGRERERELWGQASSLNQVIENYNV